MSAVQALSLATDARELSTEGRAGIEADALLELGLSYSTGRGVPQDLIQAHKYLNVAAQLGSERARYMRAEIARDMSPAQIAEAQRQAREWQFTRH